MASASGMASGADVAIVGGGVMGCGLAWRLSQRGVRTIIVERSHPAAEATGAAAGILAAQAESTGPGPFLELALHSRALHAGWSAALLEETGAHVGYARSGVLMIAGSSDELLRLQERAAWQAERGLRVERLDENTLKEAEPQLRACAGALRFPDDGHVDPRRLCAALVQAAEKRGAQLLSAEVERVVEDRGRVSGISLKPSESSGPTFLAADRIVICAGSWSSTIAGVPLPRNAVEPVHGQVVEIGNEGGSLRHVVFGDLDGGRLHGYLVPRQDGRILVGATMERLGFKKRVSTAAVRDLLTLASELAPGLSASSFRGAWAGLRPGTADGLPLLGATSLPGLYVCSGHFRNGILLAPISCDALCAELHGEKLNVPIDLAPFHPSRLDKNRA